MSRPPSNGPTAVEMPTTVPNMPKARPRSRPENICWIRAEICGEIRPPATPCTSRAITSHMLDWAAPQAAEARVKRASPAMKTARRPRASPRRPAGMRKSPKASA